MLERRNKINHSVWQRGRIREQRECDAVGDGAERWQATRAIKEDGCRADAEREGNGELVEVPPRPAPHNDGATDHEGDGQSTHGQ